MSLNIAVVGGGIVGVAVARQLLLSKPGAKVTLFEKEAALAGHQTGHNSGVIHAGLYYPPGSLKAKLTRRGITLMEEFCTVNNVPYEKFGKILVARNQEEDERLQGIYARAAENGVPGVRMLSQTEITEIEPNVVGFSGLYSPETASVDYAAITKTLGQDIIARGGEIKLNCEVKSVKDSDLGVEIFFKTGETENYDQVVVCAGLQSDRIGKKSGGDTNPRIIPFFGQYQLLSAEDSKLINGMIYPVPDPKYPFLGVHITRRNDGTVTVGPNAFLSFAREKYSLWGISIKDVWAVLTFPGFWKFALKNLPTAFIQFKTVLSAKAFIAEAREFVPALKGTKLKPLPKGIRAQAMNADGSLEDDFVIDVIGDVVLIRNAPSPGATSSLAIAEHIVNECLPTK